MGISLPLLEPSTPPSTPKPSWLKVRAPGGPQYLRLKGLMREWNLRCEPAWSEKELLHKLHDAKRILEQSLKGGDTQ